MVKEILIGAVLATIGWSISINNKPDKPMSSDGIPLPAETRPSFFQPIFDFFPPSEGP